MAFDDATGGIDRRQYHAAQSPWGNDFGDHSPRQLLAALATARERAEVDEAAQTRYQERRDRISADATRSRAAPIEARLRREKLEQAAAGGGFGAQIAQALLKGKNRDRKR